MAWRIRGAATVHGLTGYGKGTPVVRLMALILVLLASVAFLLRVVGEPPPAATPDGSIPAVEFSRLIRDYSEPGGYFRSDNFVSNETSYLHVVDLLATHQVQGGAYIGVGPEQNFTYIAKIRPHLAFIVDIRRQAMLQHLLYKAVFQMADSRRSFLSLLLSRQVDAAQAPPAQASLPDLLRYFLHQEMDGALFESTLRRVLRFIMRDCHVPLTQEDIAGIQYVLASFRDNGLNIRYRVSRLENQGMGYTGYWDGAFPTLAEILLATDLNSEPGSFLVSDRDFFFLKDLHRRNRIVPLVGDFSGPKALRSVAAHLKRSNLRVAAFYVSNVEQYLFQNHQFPGFVSNVRALPIDKKSMFIRAFAGRRTQHPANIPGHRLTTIMQRVSDFLREYDNGGLQTYWDLVITDYLAANLPIRPR